MVELRSQWDPALLIHEPLQNPMNFDKHFVGGIATGTVVAITTGIVIQASTHQIPVIEPLKLFGVTLFFALFPDVDTSSIPQRWFFRSVFVILLGLAYREYYELATVLALVSITPLLDHHRSWTHHVITAPLFGVAVTLLYEYLLLEHRNLSLWSWAWLVHHLQSYQGFLIACVVGWYTHLLLDLRRTPFKPFQMAKKSR